MGQLVEPRSKRVVVTGGAGFIGSHLCDALLERGDTVTCVDNFVGTAGSTRNVDHLLDRPGFELITADVLDWADRADLTAVDCVFHLAASKNSVALADPERDLTVNALGTLRLLLRGSTRRRAEVRPRSTGSVFGETSRPHVETLPKIRSPCTGSASSPASPTAGSSTSSTGLDYTVLRYYHVIGPRQDGVETVAEWSRSSCAPCLEGRPLTIYGTGGADTVVHVGARRGAREPCSRAESPRMRARTTSTAPPGSA